MRAVTDDRGPKVAKVPKKDVVLGGDYAEHPGEGLRLWREGASPSGSLSP